MVKIKLTEKQALMVQSIGKRKKIIVTESQYNRLKEMEVNENRPDLYTFSNEVMEFMKGLLTDHRSAGRTDFWESCGTTRKEVFDAMKDLGIIKIVETGGKNSVNVMRNGIKRKLRLLYEKLVGDKEVNEYDEPSNNRVKSKGPFKILYYNNEFALLTANNDIYFFYYSGIDKQDFADYSQLELVGPGEYSGVESVDGEAIEGYVNNNYKGLTRGKGIDSYEAGDDLVIVDKEVKDDIINTWGSDKNIMTALSSVSESSISETTVAGAAADGGSSGPYVTNAFFAKNKNKARGFKKPIYKGGKFSDKGNYGNADDLSKNIK